MPAAKQVKKEPKDKETADNLNRTSNKPTCSTSLLKAATLASKGCWLPTKPCQDSLTKRENFWHSGPRTRLANGTLPGRKQWLLLSKRQWASALVSELLEMPPESKEFKAVEKALEVAGLCDDAWDENDVAQKAYKKRWDMSKVQSTWLGRKWTSNWAQCLAAWAAMEVEAKRMQGQLFDQFQESLTQLLLGERSCKGPRPGCKVGTQEKPSLEKQRQGIGAMAQNEQKEIKLLRA